MELIDNPPLMVNIFEPRETAVTPEEAMQIASDIEAGDLSAIEGQIEDAIHVLRVEEYNYHIHRHGDQLIQDIRFQISKIKGAIHILENCKHPPIRDIDWLPHTTLADL